MKGLMNIFKSICTFAAMIFIALRACEVISWDWYLVLSPYIIYDIVAILSFAIKGAVIHDRP